MSAAALNCRVDGEAGSEDLLLVSLGYGQSSESVPEE
jgi:hypothetical protein